METDTPRHQTTSLGGTNEVTAGGGTDSRILQEWCQPRGASLSTDNAHLKLPTTDATYFSPNTIKRFPMHCESSPPLCGLGNSSRPFHYISLISLLDSGRLTSVAVSTN